MPALRRRSFKRASQIGLLLTWSVSLNARVAAQDTQGDLSSLTLEELMKVQVEGAAMHPQALEDAPASVTLITAGDIQKYGYRTLAEALSNVRGFTTNYNHTYTTVGVRGFDLPGDYASRFLVLVNGHNMADNVQNYVLLFGRDFPIDMDLIKRIEIIRGPSSALYGSNGLFATINIVTKSPDEIGRMSVTTEAASFGQKKAQVLASLPFGMEAKLLISGSLYDDGGESALFFPEFNTPSTNDGRAIGVDGEKGYHFFSNLVWGGWSVIGEFTSRRKIQPISWGETIFGDKGTSTVDSRDYVDATYHRELSRGTLKWRTYFDSSGFNGQADFSGNALGNEDNRTVFDGKWIGTELIYRFDVSHLGALTTGVEGKLDLRNVMSDRDVSPVPVEYLNVSRPAKSFAVFAQDERRLSRSWKLDLGARLDVASYQQNFVSPRAAFLYQPSSGWTYKLLYGRAFRNPSSFELFYGDGLSAVANPQARAERADTFEIDVERKLGPMNLLTAGYSYQLRDFLVGTPSQNGLIQYQNVGRIAAVGLEIEANGRPVPWLEVTTSYSLQRSEDKSERDRLENSPTHLAKLRVALPAWRRLELTSGMQYESSRTTVAGANLSPVYLADFTIVRRRLFPGLDARFGIRNTFNAQYSEPIALNPLIDAMQQPGRSVFVELVGHVRDRGAPIPK